MKRMGLLLLLLLCFSSIMVVNAIVLESDISVTDNVFSGKGEIGSFDINAEGNVLVCINQTFSYNRYIMVFQPDGALLQTFEFRFPHAVYAKFADDGNIVLYGVRSSRAAVFSKQGEILYEYSENIEKEIAEVSRASVQYYGDICYKRNVGKTQIEKCLDGTVEVFYEVASDAPEFILFWCFTMLFIICSFIFRMLRREKWLKQQKENSAQQKTAR